MANPNQKQPTPAKVVPPKREPVPGKPVTAVLPKKEDPAPLPKINDVILAHEKLMQEENLQRSDLPAKFNTKFNNLELQKKRYENTPTAGTLAAVKKQSLDLADSIQTWLEDDKKDDATEKTPETKEAAPAVEKNKSTVPTLKGTLTEEHRSILKSEGRLYCDVLKEVCGVRSLPDHFIVDGVELTRTVAFYFPVKKLA